MRPHAGPPRRETDPGPELRIASTAVMLAGQAQDPYRPRHHLMRQKVLGAPPAQQRILEPVHVFGTQITERDGAGPMLLHLADMRDESTDRGHRRPIRAPRTEPSFGGTLTQRRSQRADQRGARPSRQVHEMLTATETDPKHHSGNLRRQPRP